MTASATAIEIDLPYCSLIYGSAPCEAVLGETGVRKCFNSLKTCQDTDNYSPGTKTIRFCMPGDETIFETQAIPSLESVNLSPSTIDVGSSLGTRASLTATFKDHPYGDGNLDPYLSTRGNPYWRPLKSRFSPGTQIYSVRRSGSFWLATGGVGGSGEGGLSVSEDGESWTDYDIGFPNGESVLDIAYGNGVYVAVGGDLSGLTPTMRVTDDPTTGWEDEASGFPGSSAYFYAITYGAKFVAGGPGSANLVVSTDAESWSNVAHNLATNGLRDIAYGGGYYVVVGTNGEVSNSPDAATFTARTSGFSTTTINAVAYGDGVWIIVGNSGKLAKSTDNGSTWNIITSSFGTTNIYSVAYGEGVWIATGGSGQSAYSLDDGDTWTQEQPSGVNLPYGLAFYDGKFIAAGNSGGMSTRDSVNTYDAYRLGTFWGKFRARFPYTRGLPLRLIRTTGEDIETHNYFIETTAGPQSDQFTITAKDVLKLADGDRAQCPSISNGSLGEAIDDSDTAATLSPSGIGNQEYSASGYIAIGTEIMAFTRSGDDLTLTRAQLGTEASSHNDEDIVQEVKVYSGESAADIIYDLLVNYAEVPSAYIPLTQWETEVDTYISRLYTTYLAKPVAVKDLVNEVIEQAGLAFWWDDEDQLIRLRALRPIATDSVVVRDSDMMEGTFTQSEQQDKRVSEVWTYYNQINPLETDKDAKNFASAVLTTQENPYDQSAIKKIYSRWIAAFNRSAATRLNDMMLQRFLDPPRKFSFELWRTGSTQLSLGQGFLLQTQYVQDDEGGVASVPCIVTMINPQWDRFSIEAEEMLFTQTESEDTEFGRTIFIDVNTLNVNLRDVYDTIYTDPDGSTVVTAIIESGVIIGSSSTSRRALDIGQWPDGADITIINNGKILGCGGGGGYAISGSTPADGGDGGTALYTRFPITIDNQGIIGGGGGGGGQSGILEFAGAPRPIKLSPAGGGGAGSNPGAGGIFVGTNNPRANNDASGDNGTDALGGDGGAILNALGGDGGNIGESGTSGSTEAYGDGGDGGGPGNAVDGESFITYSAEGTISGPRVN